MPIAEQSAFRVGHSDRVITSILEGAEIFVGNCADFSETLGKMAGVAGLEPERSFFAYVRFPSQQFAMPVL